MRIDIHVSMRLHERVKELASWQGRSVSQFAREALTLFCEVIEDEIAQSEGAAAWVPLHVRRGEVDRELLMESRKGGRACVRQRVRPPSRC